jgi:hypothetical protein
MIGAETFDDTLLRLEKELGTITETEKVKRNPYDYRNHPELVNFDDNLNKLEGTLHDTWYTMNEHMNTFPTTLFHYVKSAGLLHNLSDDMYELWRKTHSVRKEMQCGVKQWIRETDPNATSGSGTDSSDDDNTFTCYDCRKRKVASGNKCRVVSGNNVDLTCYEKLPDSDSESVTSVSEVDSSDENDITYYEKLPDLLSVTVPQVSNENDTTHHQYTD